MLFYTYCNYSTIITSIYRVNYELQFKTYPKIFVIIFLNSILSSVHLYIYKTLILLIFDIQLSIL